MFIDKKTKKVYKEGDIYKHTRLGLTLQRIADNGADEFYTGQVARDLVDDITADGGIISRTDLAQYTVRWEEPVHARLPNTDFTVYTSPAPGSGSVVLAILGIAGSYDPVPPDVNRVTAWHR